MQADTQIPLLVALIGVTSALLATLLTSLLSRRHQREQQQRELMMRPSEEFARKTLEALAALRYVTPPPLRSPPYLPHRNESLLTDKDERLARLSRCETAIDVVRPARAHLRLVFHPDSAVSDSAQRVLGGLRACEAAASEYYQRAAFLAEGSEPEWRDGEGRTLREAYKGLRAELYENLDLFFNNVTARMQYPLRKQSRFSRAQIGVNEPQTLP